MLEQVAGEHIETNRFAPPARDATPRSSGATVHARRSAGTGDPPTAEADRADPPHLKGAILSLQQFDTDARPHGAWHSMCSRGRHGDLHYPPPGSAHHDRHHLRVHRSTASLLLLMAATCPKRAAQDAAAAPSAPPPRTPRRRQPRSRASRRQAVAHPARRTRRTASCCCGRRATRPVC